jgi:pleckstrin family protein M 2
MPGEAQEPEPPELDTQLPLVTEGLVPQPEPGTQDALCQLKRDQPSPCLSSAEMMHPSEFR